MTTASKVSRRGRLLLAATVVALTVAACHNSITDTMLNVSEPNIIDPANVNNADGANALKIGALARFRNMTGGTESSWLFGGLLADEWTTSSTFVQNDETDERAIQLNNASVTTQFRTINQVRTAANQAIAALRKYRPTASSDIAEMYLARAFAEMQLAQDFCNGIPLSDASVTPVVYGTPLTDDAVFKRAQASYDSAMALTNGLTDATSVLINRAAKVGKARAMLGTNDIAAAAALVAGIPTSFSYDHTFLTSSGDNILWNQPFSSRRYNVGDTLVKTSAGSFTVKPSIPFGSAKDPRLPVSNSPAGTKSQDGSVISFTTTLWAQSTTVPVINGIDARMVEAEAALRANDGATLLSILNALRAAPPKLGEVQPTVMPPLVDPGTAAARTDLLFWEKAFWTFSRGQRLSDMRRLERQYNRADNTVFPTGTHYRGVPYGTDTNLPVPQDETNNPNFTGCIDRKP
ncbi:MAG: hypothetical protein HY084_02890 [Gemmatimonadetes bacterium]|nr:hypothetical protein [Gemmatimonadota bacterium]